MMSVHPRRSLRQLSLFLVLLASVLAMLVASLGGSPAPAGKGKEAQGYRRSGVVESTVMSASAGKPVAVPARGPSGFTPQTRLGFTSGDQWEPSIAADRFGHVYLLYPQYLGVPGCADCFSPTMILQVSSDRGANWAAPRVIYPAGQTTGQWDPQIVVDPVDGRTVYTAWLQDGKSDIAVGKSTDFGASWSVVIANATNAATDKPILAVRGPDVYVGYNHAQKVWVSSSHDGGATFTSAVVPSQGLGWSLAGGGTVDSIGNVYFGWAGYERNGQAKGPVNLYISKSVDGGSSWQDTLVEVSASPPDCSAFLCGWAFLGAQLTLASDPAGTLYALWNSGTVDRGPERIYFATSTDAGGSWSAKADASLAPDGVGHAFPAVTAGAAGDVRIAWMDDRAPGGLWNTYYRRSANGGATWSAEVDLSTPVSGFSYITPDGFSFPFGDYFELDIDDRGDTHAVWGEGLNWDSPGSIWYANGR